MHANEILFSPTGGTAKVAASGDPDRHAQGLCRMRGAETVG